MGGGDRGQPDADKSGQGEGEVKNYQIFADVLYGQPLMLGVAVYYSVVV